MITFNKRGKIFAIAVLVILTAIAGFIIEHFEGETFTEEIITKSESNGYTSELPSQIDGKININSATTDELMLIDGIGEVIAGRIVDYRTEHGPFSQTEGLMLVPGIGEKTYESIKDDICVN